MHSREFNVDPFDQTPENDASSNTFLQVPSQYSLYKQGNYLESRISLDAQLRNLLIQQEYLRNAICLNGALPQLQQSMLELQKDISCLLEQRTNRLQANQQSQSLNQSINHVFQHSGTKRKEPEPINFFSNLNMSGNQNGFFAPVQQLLPLSDNNNVQRRFSEFESKKWSKEEYEAFKVKINEFENLLKCQATTEAEAMWSKEPELKYWYEGKGLYTYYNQRLFISGEPLMIMLGLACKCGAVSILSHVVTQSSAFQQIIKSGTNRFLETTLRNLIKILDDAKEHHALTVLFKHLEAQPVLLNFANDLLSKNRQSDADGNKTTRYGFGNN